MAINTDFQTNIKRDAHLDNSFMRHFASSVRVRQNGENAGSHTMVVEGLSEDWIPVEKGRDKVITCMVRVKDSLTVNEFTEFEINGIWMVFDRTRGGIREGQNNQKMVPLVDSEAIERLGEEYYEAE